jgi:hypothetical protein
MTHVQIQKETKAQVIAQFADPNGELWEKRMGKTRLVAVI